MPTVRLSDLVAVFEADADSLPSQWEGLPPLPEAYDYGFSYDSQYQVVCSRCVQDEALRRFVFTRQPSGPCDFCHSTEHLQSTVDDLFAYVYGSLLREYKDPAISRLLYDKEDEEWLGVDVLDTSDVLNNEDSPLGDGTRLHRVFSTAVEHDWYAIDSEVGTTEQRFIWSWQSFKDRLSSGLRSTSDPDTAEPGEFSVTEVFNYFETCAAQLQSELIKIADPGLVLLRARSDPSRTFSEVKDLGPPPLANTKAQRMSEKEESVFYGSEDRETAVSETRPDSSAIVTVGQWESTQPIRYLDLGERISIPSLFDSSFAQTRPFVRFCNSFAVEIRTPVPEGAVLEDEYRPTQILAKHLRRKIPTYGGQGVDAIRYPSTFSGKANWVVFVDSRSCGSAGSGLMLELVNIVTLTAMSVR